MNKNLSFEPYHNINIDAVSKLLSENSIAFFFVTKVNVFLAFVCLHELRSDSMCPIKHLFIKTY